MDKNSISKKIGSLNKKRKGFTLMELLASMAVGVLVIMTSVAALASFTRSFNSTRQAQQDLENGRAAMEYMTKTLRMASQVSIPNPQIIYFYNSSRDECMSFKYKSSGANKGLIQVGKASKPTDGTSTAQKPCGDNYDDLFGEVDYYNLTSLFSGTTGSDNYLGFQSNASASAVGRVTMLMKIDGQNLETTVSYGGNSKEYAN